jgi:hypothetical protein
MHRLVAEEVAQVYPELVAYRDDGRPLSVAYQMLPAMLLNEIQKASQRESTERRTDCGITKTDRWSRERPPQKSNNDWNRRFESSSAAQSFSSGVSHEPDSLHCVGGRLGSPLKCIPAARFP